MDLLKARELLRKHQEGTLTASEKALLESWYLDLAKSRQVDLKKNDLEAQLDKIWEALPINQPVQDNEPETVPVRPLYPVVRWLSMAASVLLICSLGIYFYLKPDRQTATKVAIQPDKGVVLPGDNRAMLTLANGRKISLNQAQAGELAQEGSAAVVKTKDGEIVYQPTNRPNTDEARSTLYHTIATPKAGQYQVRLPDGTQVWLNAASSIRFPTAFSPKERLVSITGEVYFEVAKVKAQGKRVPFKVIAGKETIEVLGTHFNVNSYADESAIKTTLLEGSIKIKIADNHQKEVLLKPGQQAEFVASSRSKAAPTLAVQEVDTRSVVAWKEGYFQFNNVGLPELMRQIARWYDIDVVYEGPVKQYEFVGQIERNTKLDQVLKILEVGDVRFRVEGKTIIVTP